MYVLSQDHQAAKEVKGCPCSTEDHVDAVPVYVFIFCFFLAMFFF